MRWSVLKEGLRGVAVPNGSGTPASGDGESCPGGDRCSRSACGGQLLPAAPLGGWGVLPRRWSVLKEGLRGVAVPNGLGTSSGGRGVLPKRKVGAQAGRVGGSSSQQPGHTGLGGWGVMPTRLLVLKDGLQGGSSS